MMGRLPKLRKPHFEALTPNPSSPLVISLRGDRTRKNPIWLKAKLIKAKQAPVVLTIMRPRSIPNSPATAIPTKIARRGFPLIYLIKSPEE
jgi:hypothetical protein